MLRFLPFAILILAQSVFPQDKLAEFGWLAGCWSGNLDGALYEECWTPPSAGFMQGSGRLTEKGEIVMREHVTIEAEKDGSIVMYVLSYGPSLKPDQTTVGFRYVGKKGGGFAFENPAHDYPQRIIYTRRRDGSAFARIETIDGKRQVDFPLKKSTGGRRQ